MLDIDDLSYQLRPEYVESLFILYRKTKDTKFQEMAWDVFQRLEEHCRVEDGGYASLDNVNTGIQVDDMPSYFLAETLKYLFLIFAPDDYISLDDFVFTTEGHPLRKPKKMNTAGLVDGCQGKKSPPVPLPWTLVTILCVLAFLIWIICSLGIILCRICHGSQTQRKKNQ